MSGNFENEFLTQIDLYPKSTAKDLLKFLFQREFGAGHLISDTINSRDLLEKELLHAKIKTDNSIEHIGNGLCRLHLSVIKNNALSPDTLHKIFLLSACELMGSKEHFLSQVPFLKELSDKHSPLIDVNEFQLLLSDWEKSGCHPFSHSDIFREAYSPTYRVVKKYFCDFLPLLIKIDYLIKDGGRILVAIDGNCGSGKSTLSTALSEIYNANIIRMDDFFLRDEQRTEARLSEIGGNIDYERFSSEVLSPLSKGEEFSYKPYSCATRSFTKPIRITPAPLTIIEGSYSLHPKFRDFYDCKVFLELDYEEQLRRIYERSGQELLQRFISEWIPMENNYFKEFSIKESADISFFTSDSN